MNQNGSEWLTGFQHNIVHGFNNLFFYIAFKFKWVLLSLKCHTSQDHGATYRPVVCWRNWWTSMVLLKSVWCLQASVTFVFIVTSSQDMRIDQTLKLSAASLSEYFEILKWTLRLSAWFIHPGCDVKDSRLFPEFKASIAFKDKSTWKSPLKELHLEIFEGKAWRGKNQIYVED